MWVFAQVHTVTSAITNGIQVCSVTTTYLKTVHMQHIATLFSNRTCVNGGPPTGSVA